MKAGTRIELSIIKQDGTIEWEPAKIGRWMSYMGPRDRLPEGYHPVRFADGGRLMVHESGFRVVSNN